MKTILDFVVGVAIIFSIGWAYDYYQRSQYAELEKAGIEKIRFFSEQSGFIKLDEKHSSRGGNTSYEFVFLVNNDNDILRFSRNLENSGYIPRKEYDHHFLCKEKESVSFSKSLKPNQLTLMWRYPNTLCVSSE